MASVKPKHVSILTVLLLFGLNMSVNGWSWAPVGTGVEGTVYALCVYNNELYVAGDLKTAGGKPVYNIARWNGATWSSLGAPGIEPVHALAVYKTELYAGGYFNEDENIQSNLFKWTGNKWEPIKTKHQNTIFTLAVYHSELYAGGTFLKNEDAHIMKWDGKTLTDAGVKTNGAVSAFAVHDDKLYAGGHFLRANDKHTTFIVSFDGTQWQPTEMGLDGSPQSWVKTLIEFNDDLFTAVNFSTGFNAKNTSNICLLSKNGWSRAIDLNGPVYATAVYNNRLFIGGRFTFTNGTSSCYNICSIQQ